MYEFLDRLISLALPRVRDFRGLNPNAFDGHGNYSLGLSEQLVFPELNPDKYTRPQGMNISLVISTNNNDESRELLKRFGLPFKTETAGMPVRLRISFRIFGLNAWLVNRRLPRHFASRSFPRAASRGANCAAGPAACIASSACAGFTSVNWATKA